MVECEKSGSCVVPFDCSSTCVAYIVYCFTDISSPTRDPKQENTGRTRPDSVVVLSGSALSSLVDSHEPCSVRPHCVFCFSCTSLDARRCLRTDFTCRWSVRTTDLPVQCFAQPLARSLSNSLLPLDIVLPLASSELTTLSYRHALRSSVA